MLNSIVKVIFNKEIVLYNHHRQTEPIINNTKNKKDYIFINSMLIWRLFPLPGKYKLKFRVVYILLNIINPKYIIDINWISKWQSLYKVWTRKHKSSKFIVVQHGSYVGGVVTDVAHRYTKCDVFLTWGTYFKYLFEEYNFSKKTSIIAFGNPVYNLKSRNEFSFSDKTNGKILIVPSVISEDRLLFYIELFDKLKHLGFTIYFKGHNYQGRKIKSKGKEVYFPEITGVNKISGNLSEILKNNEYDLIISDHSSALLDAIFFKNKVLYFAPDYPIKEYSTNNYSKYLENLFFQYKGFTKKEDVYSFISVKSQEKLLSQMIYEGDNILNNYI